MSTFPLYENLKNDKQNITIDKPDFIRKFKLLDVPSHSLIYALIKSYQIDKKINILSSSLPFDGVKLKRCVVKNKFSGIWIEKNQWKSLFKENVYTRKVYHRKVYNRKVYHRKMKPKKVYTRKM